MDYKMKDGLHRYLSPMYHVFGYVFPLKRYNYFLPNLTFGSNDVVHLTNMKRNDLLLESECRVKR